MSDQDEGQFREELKRKAEELKGRTFEEESRKIAREAEERALQTVKARSAQESQAVSRRLQEAQAERRKQEESLKSQEQEVIRKLRTEAARRSEARNRAEQEIKRKEEEERKAQEAAERRRKEEEQRKVQEQERARREEERRKIVDAERRKADAEKERKDADARRKEAERLQKEEAAQGQAKEREERIKSLVARAQVFFEEGDLEHASVEAAKALVNDPANAEALDLERRIKEAQGKKAEEAKSTRRGKKKLRPLGHEVQPITNAKKKPYAPAMMMVAFIAIVIVSVLVVLEVRKSVSTPVFSVAVFPWTASGGELEANVIGSSLAEETSGRLHGFSALTVMDFASAYSLAQGSTDPEQSAFRLGFRYAVLGTITKAPAGYAVAVRLIDSLRTTLWTGTFEVSPESLAMIPRELPKQIATEMGPNAAEMAAGFVPVRALPGSDAYMMYLKGLELLHRCTKESTLNALQLFQQAIEEDGSFAEAMAVAGNVMAERVERGWDETDSTLARAKEYAVESVGLDPTISEGYRALGNVCSQRKDFQTALSEFDTAARFSPKSGKILADRARALLQIGKYQDALVMLSRAYELSPRDPGLLQTYASAQRLNGQARQSSAFHLAALACAGDSDGYLMGPFEDAVVLDPDLSLSQSDRVASAFRARLRVKADDYESMYRFARLLQVTGKAAEAGDMLGRCESLLRGELKRNPKNGLAMIYLALALTRQGKYSETGDLAQKALALDKRNAEIRYRAAQMYSLQMYSLKDKTIDPRAKENAIAALRQAVNIGYRLDELTNADFYNLSDQPEFKTAIEHTL